MSYWIWIISAFAWMIVWITDLVINGSNNLGALACALASFALVEINDMNKGK